MKELKARIKATETHVANLKKLQRTHVLNKSVTPYKRAFRIRVSSDTIEHNEKELERLKKDLARIRKTHRYVYN